MEMKLLKKALLQEKIRITIHAKKQMQKRGYTNSDIISCIWGGEMTKTQFFNNRISVIVEGKDMDCLPIILIVGKDIKNSTRMVVISVFPPIKNKFQSVI